MRLLYHERRQVDIDETEPGMPGNADTDADSWSGRRDDLTGAAANARRFSAWCNEGGLGQPADVDEGTARQAEVG